MFIAAASHLPTGSKATSLTWGVDEQVVRQAQHKEAHWI